VRLPS